MNFCKDKSLVTFGKFLDCIGIPLIIVGGILFFIICI